MWLSERGPAAVVSRPDRTMGRHYVSPVATELIQSMKSAMFAENYTVVNNDFI
jgi:hypothetical protein